MSRYAILRTQKLKHLATVGRSLKHSFREQDTPNADENLRAENVHIGAKSSAEALDAMKARLPEKRRRDAVLAIEYLVTASPEAMKGKTRAEQDAYFEDSLEWLRQKHGAENLIYAGIHRDETTPHLYAYAVPIDPETKNLNAKKWLGGAKALADMQTEFVDRVAARHGLERGLERSKAQHQTVKQFYAQTNKLLADKHQIVIEPEQLKKQVIDKNRIFTTSETPELIAARLSREATAQVKELVGMASVSSQERQRMRQTRERLAQLQEPFKGLKPAQEAKVLELAKEMQLENQQELENRKQKIIERDRAKQERRRERRGISH